MKLSKKVSVSKKNGKEYVSYEVKKMNETGYGFLIDQPLKGTFTFEPRMNDVTFTDKKTGEEKTFTACSAVINVTNVDDFENLELNEYGSAQFNLPEKFVPIIKEAGHVKGKGVEILLKSFEDSDGNAKNTWVMNIEGSSGNPQKTLPEQTNTNQPVKPSEEEVSELIQHVINEHGSLDLDLCLKTWFANKHEEEYSFIVELVDAYKIKEKK